MSDESVESTASVESAKSTVSVGPVLRVVKGEPTAEELAALVAVVTARAAAGSTAAAAGPDEDRAGDWASYWRNVRRPLQHGPGRWRASAHPH